MTYEEYQAHYPERFEPSYCGQPADQGLLTPHPLKGEGFATLKCGGTEVQLSYSALHLISGWLSAGAIGYGMPEISRSIIAAINAVTCEASLGRSPIADVAMMEALKPFSRAVEAWDEAEGSVHRAPDKWSLAGTELQHLVSVGEMRRAKTVYDAAAASAKVEASDA